MLFKYRKSSRLNFLVILVLLISVLYSFFVVGDLGYFSDKVVDSDDFRGVVLGSSDGAYGFGHVALLLETEEGWFYFSWQSMKVVFSEVPEYALVSLDAFNAWIDEDESLQNYIYDFDSAFYFRGDFSGSVSKAEEFFDDFVLSQNLDKQNLNVSLLHVNPEYNVFFNNCIYVAFDVLGEAVVGGVFVKDFVSEPSFIAVIGVKQLESSLSKGGFFS